MPWQALIVDGYGRVLEVLEEALDGLTPDDLNEQPHPDCNSMGWLAWHLTRVQDDHVAIYGRGTTLGKGRVACSVQPRPRSQGHRVWP